MYGATSDSFPRVMTIINLRIQTKRFARFVLKKKVLYQSQFELLIVIRQISFPSSCTPCGGAFTVESSHGKGKTKSIDERITIKTAAKDGCFFKSNLYSRGSNKWKDLTDSVMHCIAKDMLPIRIVEKEGFRALIKKLDSHYELPSRKYMSKKAIPELYSVTRESVKSQISTTEFFSATTNIWSSSTMEPYGTDLMQRRTRKCEW